MLKRILLIGTIVLVLFIIVASIGLWIGLSSWLPIKGKARLIEILEQHTPADIAIGTLAYRPFQGIILTDVRVIHRPTQQQIGVAPAIRVQLNWMAFVLTRQVVFRAGAALTQPLDTVITMSGRYRMKEPSLVLDVETSDIPRQRIGAPLSQYVPAALTAGTFHLKLRLTQSAEQPAIMTGRIEGTHLLWTTPTVNMRGDVAFDGTVTPPTVAGGPWGSEGEVTLRRATAEGLPTIGTIERLEGTARLSADGLNIREVSGMALGSRWTLEGHMTMPPRATIDVSLHAHANIVPLMAAFPLVNNTWQPTGAADVQAVCRGPLQPIPFLDCLATARLKDGRLAGSQLVYPLTHMNGEFGYDLLTRRLSIASLRATLKEQPFTLSGHMDVQDPVRLGLHVAGTIPLEMIQPWLPTSSPITHMSGQATVDLALEGPIQHPVCTGGLALDNGSLHMAKPSITLEHAVSAIRFTPGRIALTDTALTMNGQPLTLSAIFEPANTSRLIATIGFPHGQLRLTSRVTPTDILIDDGRLALNTSQLEIRGRIARQNDHASAVDVSGTIELAEMSALPWLPLSALEAWHLEGMSTVGAQFRGRLSDWPGAIMQGQVRADRLRVRDIPIEQVTITLEQRDGVLRVRVPSSVIAQGNTWGELVIEHRRQAPPSTFLLHVDVTGLQLATLAHAIPAWRSRSVTGTASTRALILGAWNARSTWHGEGWLNASGERLADLPLLDKVFRGLFGVLGDRLGLESLRRAQITHASCRWRLTDERVHTDDLRLGGVAGTDPVAVYANGSVGLNRTLDFVIEPELSEGVLVQAPTTSTLASTVLKAAGGFERLRRLIGRHRLTGTLDDPEYRFEFTTQEIFKQLAPGPGDLFQQLLDAVN